jgi:hypothetical protein
LLGLTHDRHDAGSEMLGITRSIESGIDPILQQLEVSRDTGCNNGFTASHVVKEFEWRNIV